MSPSRQVFGGRGRSSSGAAIIARCHSIDLLPRGSMSSLGEIYFRCRCRQISLQTEWTFYINIDPPPTIHLQLKTAKWIDYWWWTRIDRNIVLYYFPREMVLWMAHCGRVAERKMITKLRAEIERTNWTNRIFLFAIAALDVGRQWCMKDIFNKLLTLLSLLYFIKCWNCN